MSQSLLKSCKNVLVVGAGLMGAGIAQVCAENGMKVVVADTTTDSLERGKQQMRKMLARKKEDVEVESIMNMVHFTKNVEDGATCDFAIEAVPEKLSIKQDVFRRLDSLLDKDVIIASNTSSLSIAAISSVTKRPDKVVGVHFFSPVPLMRLVEIVRSIQTSEETVQYVQTFSKAIQKETILAQDYPGFIVNRVLVPMLNEAAYLVYEGNDPEEVDRGMLLGTNHPIGPLKLADSVGIDVLLFTLESLYEGFNDSKYRPCPLLKRMVEGGLLGKKTKRGFYHYE